MGDAVPLAAIGAPHHRQQVRYRALHEFRVVPVRKHQRERTRQLGQGAPLALLAAARQAPFAPRIERQHEAGGNSMCDRQRIAASQSRSGIRKGSVILG